MNMKEPNIHYNEQSSTETQSTRYLTFTLCSEQYAIPLLEVKEVIGLTDTTPMPQTPAYFKGIMNLRGRVISVIDLRVKFKMTPQDLSGEEAIIILDIEGLSLGVIVDSVDRVVALAPTEISDPPAVDTSSSIEHIVGVARKDERLILLLDAEKIFSVNEIKKMKNIA